MGQSQKEFIDFLIDEAKCYSKGLLLSGILHLLKDDTLTVQNVKAIINPFLKEIEPMLDKNLKMKLDVSLIDFAPIALDRMCMNSFMHRGDETSLINKVNVDALLVTYFHFTFNIPTLHSDYLSN